MSSRRSRSGGQIDGHHVEAIIKVFAETARIDLFQQIAIAGGDDAGVDADRLRIAHALELVLLEHAEQFDLELGGGGVDLVEEDGAGVGGLEAAGAVIDRPGEGPADVAEQLAFQQVLVQCAAVHANEGPAAPRTEAVDGLGDQFLARARLAQQQHRGVRLGHLPHEPIAMLHGRPGADQARDRRTMIAVRAVSGGGGNSRHGRIALFNSLPERRCRPLPACLAGERVL